MRMCVLGWAGHLLHKWMAHICRRLQVGLHVSYIRGAVSKVHVGCIRKPSDMQVPKVHLAHLGQLDHVHTYRLLLAAESCKADIWFPELVCSLVEVWLCILKTDIARAVLHMYVHTEGTWTPGVTNAHAGGLCSACPLLWHPAHVVAPSA